MSCEGCNSRLAVPETAAGKKLRCPKCQTVIDVPAPTAQAPKPSNPKPPNPKPLKKKPEPENYDSDFDDEVDWVDGGASDHHDPYANASPYAASPSSMMPGRSARRSEAKGASGSGSNQKAITSGVLMIVGSIVWFFGALIFLDRLFFYPPILLIIGIVTIIKGFRGES
ncbi:MAG: hypothetical protein JNL58_13615 [Planctomyces sp.]|nr:hypothetical protein [Planctomyces sp.]